MSRSETRHDPSGHPEPGTTALPKRVEIIDCTLRDGEQAPGVWFSVAEKLALATALDEAGVDVLDAGFPASSASDIEAMQGMRMLGLHARIGATARPLPGDVAAAEKARAHEVFLFMPTSDFRLKETLNISRKRATEIFRAGAEDVVTRGMRLNLVFEDASRADITALIAVVEALRKHVPIERLVLADTVGCATPASMEVLVSTLRRAVGPEIALCPHGHNDFGMATANTLAAVAAGASSVTCTVNGIGERAGNADLAEVTAALTFLYGIEHRVDVAKLQALSQMVERMSGLHMSPTKPVTGLNVFRHESGVHVDGMLKTPKSYEFLPSAAVGRDTEYVLGKHSGTGIIRKIMQDAGIAVDDAVAAELLQVVKQRIEERDKKQHERMFWRSRAFHSSCLSGLDPEEVLGIARQRLGLEPRKSENTDGHEHASIAEGAHESHAQ